MKTKKFKILTELCLVKIFFAETFLIAQGIFSILPVLSELKQKLGKFSLFLIYPSFATDFRETIALR